ncbi:MAG: TraR/DksA C4-type zinc finger protein [bacterium]|nr:TraR/DksA C4-type zinc finger protein [bacterium]
MPNTKSQSTKTTKRKRSPVASAKSQFEHYRKLLLEKKARILGDVEELEKQSLLNSQRDAAGDLSDYSLHMADVGTDAAERETMLGLASTQQKMVDKIERALERIEQGTYGTCELCGGKISPERLEALPEANTCVTCMRKYNL